MSTTSPNTDSVSTPDGISLSLRHWPSATAVRGRVLIVHGLGEHIGRYDAVAAHLNASGWDVWGYDQRGHGSSGGVRGALRTAHDLLGDLVIVVDRLRTDTSSSQSPLVLLGHSMGGLVAAQFVGRALRPVDALVITSPALDAGLSLSQRLQLAVGRLIVPDLAMSNQLDANMISHDPAVVIAYKDDPLVHDRVTARLARALVDGGKEVLSMASEWTVPTLLMWSGADRLVSPAGSAAFAARAPSALVKSRCFDGLYHEILNELEAKPVYDMLDTWLDERFAR